MKAISCATLLCLAGLGPVPAHAQDEPGTISIPFSVNGDLKLGDALSILAPSINLGRCVDYDASDVTWDTGGALRSTGKVDIISSYEQRKREEDILLGYKTTADVKLGVFSGNSSLDITGHSNVSRTDEDRSVTVSFQAFADYGRRMIEDYELKPAMAALLAGNPDEFRKRCGSHFVRGQRRFSELSILVNITSRSRQGKDVLEATLQQTLGGGVTIDSLTASGTQTLTANYKKILEFAKQTGRVRVDYVAQGGPGIQAAGEATAATDPADLPALASILKAAATHFSQDNSSVSRYILLPNASMGAPAQEYDLERIRKVGALARQLRRLNEASTRYDEYRSKAPGVYGQYFAQQHVQLAATRAALVEKIKTCALGGACADPSGDVLRDYPFLEDMFQDQEVELSCSYQKASVLSGLAADPGAEDPMVLESISIDLTGTVRHYDAIDWPSLKVSAFTPDLEVKDLTPGFSGFSFSNEAKRQAFGTIYQTNLRSRDLVTYASARKAFTVDELALAGRRDGVLASAYFLKAAGPAGFTVSQEVGFPPRTGCPLTKR